MNGNTRYPLIPRAGPKGTVRLTASLKEVIFKAISKKVL